MKTIAFKRGWVDRAVPGEPFRMEKGVEVKDQLSQKQLREHGKFYSVKHWAEQLGFTDDTIYKWITVGDEARGGRKLESFKVGGQYRISEHQMEAFLNAEVQAQSKAVRRPS
jgi:excisionase family DNA binding protein